MTCLYYWIGQATAYDFYQHKPDLGETYAYSRYFQYFHTYDIETCEIMFVLTRREQPIACSGHAMTYTNEKKSLFLAVITNEASHNAKFLIAAR